MLLRKTKPAFWIILVGLVAGSATVSVARGPSHSTANSEFYRQLQLFGEVLQIVRSDYIEKTDDPKLIEAAINGMLSSLDPIPTISILSRWANCASKRAESSADSGWK